MDLGVMVLTAGLGTRLGPLTESAPKPLVPIAGRPVLAWTLEWLAAAGVREVWLNLHHRGEDIRAEIGDGTRFGLSVRYSPEETLLGTAGGWRRVAALAQWQRWLVVYGDNLMRFDLSALLRTHEAAAPASATVALFDPRRHANSGIAGGYARLGPDGRVVGFVEGGPLPEAALVNAGAYVLEASVVQEVPRDPADFGRDVLPGLAAAGRLHGHVLEDGAFCLGLDTPEALECARGMMSLAEVAP